MTPVRVVDARGLRSEEQRLAEEERKLIHEAAAAMSLDASAWARSLLLSQARKVLGRKPGER